MNLITQIAKNVLKKRIRDNSFSVSCLGTFQTESLNQERKTHFGFEQVNESEKQQKGKI